MMLTYFTPTYNRAELLVKLYESLLKQTNKDFIWLIVDDGSTDNTKNIVDTWVKSAKINIKYILKENGGKNTAIDLANKICETEFICCVDSDDFLVEEATEVLYSYFPKITENGEDIVGLVGRRAHFDLKPFSENWATENDVIYFHELVEKYGYKEDTVLVFKTNIVKKYSFPKISNEKFITESVFYNQFMFKYKLMMMTENIYLSEYQDIGYTSQGMNLFFKNPNGFLYSLWQNAYFYILYSHSIKRKISSIANYYAWECVLKTSKMENPYHISWIYRFLGKIFSIKFYKKFRDEYKAFLKISQGEHSNG